MVGHDYGETRGGQVPLLVDPRTHLFFGDAPAARRCGWRAQRLTSGSLALGYMYRDEAPDKILVGNEPATFDGAMRQRDNIELFGERFRALGARIGRLFVIHVLILPNAAKPIYWEARETVLDSVEELGTSAPDGLQIQTGEKRVIAETGIDGYYAEVTRERILDGPLAWDINGDWIRTTSLPPPLA